MVEAIAARKPSGIPARLENYELLVQSWDEIPLEARKVLQKHWGTNFRTYCIKPKRGAVVTGYVWFLTPAERERINRWEFWYKPITVWVTLDTGETVEAESEMIDSSEDSESADGENYPMFLNDKHTMLEIARKVWEYH